MTNKQDFLKHAKHLRKSILMTAVSNVVYKLDNNLAYKQEKLVDVYEQGKCYLRVYLTDDPVERDALKNRFARLYGVNQHRGFATEDETKRLVMPVSIGEDNISHGNEPMSEKRCELTADELSDIGFHKWDDVRDENGRTLWLCPLWLAPFLKCGQPVDSISEKPGLTILPPDQMDMDHRGGLCSWGFKLKA